VVTLGDEVGHLGATTDGRARADPLAAHTGGRRSSSAPPCFASSQLVQLVWSTSNANRGGRAGRWASIERAGTHIDLIELARAITAFGEQIIERAVRAERQSAES
jgi:hypothetical protein